MFLYVRMALTLTSAAFEHGKKIPKDFTCEGEDVSPKLMIRDVPNDTKSLVLIVDDPDAPPKVWEHWTVINIDPKTAVIEQGAIPGMQLMNDFDRVEWGGPCPPPGKVHNYQFKLYALDTELSLGQNSRKADVEEAMEGHVLDQTVLVGTYKR